MAKSAKAREFGIMAPFLRSAQLLTDRVVASEFPYTLPIFAGGNLRIDFTMPITFLVGENGTGKSTLLEAIAVQCGFSRGGGSQDHRTADVGPEDTLPQALRLAWKPKVGNGVFFRAESFFNLARYLDQTGSRRYGERDLHAMSHGEAFLGFIQHRFETSERAIFLLDEPEAALSPSRQMAFLTLLHRWHRSSRVQAIIVTHSPIILAYPNATILSLDKGVVHEIAYGATEHYLTYRAFLTEPERYLRYLLKENESDEQDERGG